MAKTKKAKLKLVPKTAQNNSEKKLYIVGIGASAGGLEALEIFFNNLPTKSDMAFVVISHMGTPQKSLLPELLQRHTKIKVSQIQDGTKIMPNNIYVISPGQILSTLNGFFRLIGHKESAGVTYPIDTFFKSLALDYGDRAIGVILSGTGSDGTLGLKEISKAGGLAIVEDPKEAKYDGMPKSALESGYVDFSLPVKEISQQLALHGNRAVIIPGQKKDPLIPKSYLEKIIAMIRNATGHDLSLYKTGTISRRIEKRINTHRLKNIAQYVRYLDENPQEAKLLFNETLIGVTSFFRDNKAFDILRDKIFPLMVKDKDPNYTFRFWVPGCSSGEEAYSLAIIFQEFLERTGKQYRYQIFSTDIDEAAINKARTGIYGKEISSDVSSARLKKYFSKEGDNYSIKKNIREKVVFAVQDITRDSPFSKLDMVSCRNMLIYMNQDLHQKIIPLFQYTLNPGGILFLGSSETIGSYVRNFSIIDKKWKIYRASPINYKTRLILNSSTNILKAGHCLKPDFKNSEPNMRQENKPSLESLTEKSLFSDYVPASVVINEQGDILYVHGKTGNFLEPAEGESSFNIFEMAKESLRIELRSSVRKTISQKRSMVREELQVKNNGKCQVINLITRPLLVPGTGQNLILVIFEEIKNRECVELASKKSSKSSIANRTRNEELEKELKYTKEDLQTTIEELEASNEELRSSVEELQSSNEELQSTNEELETSREELQSLNEELNTLNAEQESKVGELIETRSNFKNLMEATKIATIFLDNDLRIKSFTPEILSIFNLIPSDIGRPIIDIATNFEHVNFLHDIKKVFETLVVNEQNIKIKDGKWFHMRILPYRSLTNVIEGVVITFMDITEIKTLSRLAAVVEYSNDAVIVQDLDGSILAWNQGATKMYGWTEAEALSMNISETIPENDRKQMKLIIEKIQKDKKPVIIHAKRRNKNKEILNVSIAFALLYDDNGNAESIATTEHYISLSK